MSDISVHINNLLITFQAAVVGSIKQIQSRVTALKTRGVVEKVRKQFGINSSEVGHTVDFIRVDYPQSRNLMVSETSTFCFHIIYMVTRNADFCEGRGPMVPHAFFFDMYEALDYMYDIPGVQGRRANWAEESFGDYQIEIQIVHDTALSAHTVNEVAAAIERANANLAHALVGYKDRHDLLTRHQIDASHLVKPKLEDYLRETRRDFLRDN